jgi:hypothetical protein
VQLVFDRPVAACGRGEGCRRKRPGRDIGSPFGFDLVAALDPALDHGDGGEFGKARCAGIGARCAIPIDHLGDGVVADLEAAVVLVEGLDLVDLGGRRGFE